MAVVRPGNEERAWNDPPQFAYHQDSQTPPAKRLLNKRVPFPQTLIPSENKPSSSTVGTLLPSVVKQDKQDFSNVVLLPPSTTTSVPPTCPTVLVDAEGTHIPSETVDSSHNQVISEVAKTAEEIVSEDEMLLFLMSVLNRVLSDLSGKIQKRIQDDITRRISILSCVWDKKLSLYVKMMMYKLAKELTSGNYEAADSIHCSLMVDYISEVSQWMVGIKRIIHEAKLLSDGCSENWTIDEGKTSEVNETEVTETMPVSLPEDSVK